MGRQSEAFWRWEFAASPLGPARIFIAEDDAGIVGHLAFVPQQYRIGGRTIDALLAVDAMVDERRRRESVFSALARHAVDRLRRDVPLLVAWQIRKAVLPPMLAAGFHVAGTIPLLIGPASIPLALAQYRRRGTFTEGKGARPAQHAGDFELRTPTQTEIATMLEVGDDGVSLSMTPQFFEWRFLSNPAWHYRITGAFRGGTICAMTVVRDTLMKGMPTRAIVHVAQRAGCGDATRALVGAERVAARQSGIGLLSSLVSREHAAHRAMMRAGLVPGPFRFRQLVQPFDASIADAVMRGRRSLTWASTDHV